MKVLLDTCVWGGVKENLESIGYNVIWSGDWERDPGDIEILSYAYNEKRILVTLDKDFGELAVLHGYPHCGILRLVDISAKQQAVYCQKILERYEKDLLDGAIITADNKKIRIRSNS